MINVPYTPQNAGFYPGCRPAMIENHTNPEAEQFRQKMYDELRLQQAICKVEFIQNTIKADDNHEPNKEMSKVQRNVAEMELQNAQRELAIVKQQIGAQKGVHYA